MKLLIADINKNGKRGRQALAPILAHLSAAAL